jgi:hypothetical protein
LLAVTALFAAITSWAGEWQYEDVGRVVAISDVHGAYGAMVKTLQNAAVIDEDHGWAGGETHLVIVGDILDRGPDSRPVMDLLMQLENEAAEAGGKVHVLIGNHEAMNLSGDLRYVAREEYAAFAPEETVEQRQRWFDAYAAKRSQSNALTRAEFDDEFPPGFFAHRRAFKADGKYGAWLLEKPVIVVINGIAYVHGGLSPRTAELGLEGINRDLVSDLKRYVEQVAVLIDAGILMPSDNSNKHAALLNNYLPPPYLEKVLLQAIAEVRKLSASPLFETYGPLWYRGNVACGQVIEEQRLAESLEKIGASKVVIGHTPTTSRQILQRFDGRIVEVDTGMLRSYYRGSGNALVIENDDMFVVSESGARLEDPLPHPRRVGARPNSMTAAQLEAVLQQGQVSNRREDRQLQRITYSVADGGNVVDAVFVKRKSKGFYPNVAAYRLDKMLGLGMVPVTVRRDVDGHDGSLQFLPGKTMDEGERDDSGWGGSAWCPLADQWPAMYLFDVLIFNEGRTTQRMLYSTDLGQLILSEHQNAFAARKGRPRHLNNAPVVVTSGWRAALQALDLATLESELGDVLDSKRLRALDQRRQKLLQSAD